MKDAHIFRLLGLLYLGTGVGSMLEPQAYVSLIHDMTRSPSFMWLGGLLSLFIGFLLVTFHNHWVLGWSVFITIVGWLALVKGIVALALPSSLIAAAEAYVSSPAQAFSMGIISTVLGVIFSALGYFVVKE